MIIKGAYHQHYDQLACKSDSVFRISKKNFTVFSTSAL